MHKAERYVYYSFQNEYIEMCEKIQKKLSLCKYD